MEPITTTIGGLILFLLGWIKIDLGRIETKLDGHITNVDVHN